MSRRAPDPRRTPFIRLAERYARRRFGRVLDPGRAVGRNPKVLMTRVRFEHGVQKWHALEPAPAHLAVMASAVRVGCSWGGDLGHRKPEGLGLPMEKAGKVPVRREHREDFTEFEQGVMEYAEAMSETEPFVTDEMARGLFDRLGEAASVWLTASSRWRTCAPGSTRPRTGRPGLLRAVRGAAPAS
ncbi:carboxymuconolactone decarboxylase family protein [Actinacidiphila sp. bgisy160]|uniref:carboxymuconolactone decarboxylase family protein n=1 Tax=Actinacidiphila sp. bgisy160 TaxID=3413796 RepID=UPI003D71E7C9